MSTKVPIEVKFDIMKLIKAKKVKTVEYNNLEGWIDLSAIKVSILKIKRDAVILQLSTEHEGKEFEIQREVEMHKGDRLFLYTDDSFKAKRKIKLT